MTDGTQSLYGSRGTRRGKRSRTLRRQREADDRYGPDTSIVVHTFDDDWTINRLVDLNDIWREGFLMRNCLAQDKDFDNTVFSLRDTDNHPHLTILHEPATGLTHSETAKLPGTTLQARIAAGAHGTVKPEYQDRVRQWLATLPYDAFLILDRVPVFDETSDIELDTLYLQLAAALEGIPHDHEPLLEKTLTWRWMVETFAARSRNREIYVTETRPEHSEAGTVVPANPWGTDPDELRELLDNPDSQYRAILDALDGTGRGPWVVVSSDHAQAMRNDLEYRLAAATIEDEVTQELLWHTQDADETRWENETYDVTVRDVQFSEGVPLTHLEITRHDREPIHNWRDLQELKNTICGPEREGIEVYPATDRAIDFSNTYHLWVYPEGHRIL